MSKVKLFVAHCDKKTIHFDNDGRLYELNLNTNTYLPTGKYVFDEYYAKPLFLKETAYYNTGLYNVADDITYEIVL